MYMLLVIDPVNYFCTFSQLPFLYEFSHNILQCVILYDIEADIILWCDKILLLQAVYSVVSKE